MGADMRILLRIRLLGVGGCVNHPPGHKMFKTGQARCHGLSA